MCNFDRPRSDLDSKTTISIDGSTFEVAADDLEVIAPLGRGAYGVVEKMRHRPSDTILAVKVGDCVSTFRTSARTQKGGVFRMGIVSVFETQ